jgi:hypothetical protein
MAEDKSTSQDMKELNRRVEQLAREYDKLKPGDPRHTEIANEICELRLKVESLQTKQQLK